MESEVSPPAFTKAPPLSHAVIFPKGAMLPQGFPTNSLPDVPYGDCLRNGAPCEIFVLTRPASSDPAILVYTPASEDLVPVAEAELWTKGGDAKWVHQSIPELMFCPAALEALRAGQYAIEPSKRQDLIVAGLRIQMGAAPASNCLTSQKTAR